MPASDADLVAAALARDAAGRAAFETLVVRHHPMLSRACLRALDGDRALAADAAQDAVLQALVGLGSLREPGAFGPWLTGIGLRVARRLGMRARRDGGGDLVPDVVAPDGDDPALATERRATVARVRAAVAALPPGQRDAVFLYYLAGLSRAEVAEHLGTAESAVRTRLHKARATLRARLDEGSDVMVTVEIADVRVTGEERYSTTHVVVLQERGGARRLPIWIDTFDAVSLAAALEDVDLPRPGTFAFALALLGAAGRSVAGVTIERLDADAGVFYAVVELDDGATLDARPSDALNVAVRAGVTIRVAEALLDGAEPVPEGGRGALELAEALRERLAQAG